MVQKTSVCSTHSRTLSMCSQSFLLVAVTTHVPSGYSKLHCQKTLIVRTYVVYRSINPAVTPL